MLKKLLLSILLGFFINSNAQLLELFNDITIPSSWLVTNNGIGLTQSWTTAINPPICEGERMARCTIENIGQGNTSMDWLISPLATVPSNGQIRFSARSGLAGNQGTLLKVFISTAANQSDLSSFTLLQQYTEDQLSTVFNVCEDKIISFPISLVGQSVYIAFVREFTQTTSAFPAGDTFFIDNVGTISQCMAPTGMTASNITSTSAVLSWSPSVTAQIELVIGSGAPTGVPTHMNLSSSSMITGLLPNTNYCYYIRTICPNGLSNWSTTPTCFSTPISTNSCGGIFTDNGGANSNYLPNSDLNTTICPNSPGNVVSVNFATFQTEINKDALYIFNGNSLLAPQIASTNPAADVPGGLAGGYWGEQLLNQTITSSSPDGCLTFRFRSNATTQLAGWVASVICSPTAQSCSPPTNVVAVPTQNSVTVSWSQGVPAATQWEVLVLPAGSPVPLITTPVNAANIATNNPYIITGLLPNTSYCVFIRSICPNGNGTSNWTSNATSTGTCFTTQITPPVCGGFFTDNGGPNGNYLANSDVITTICSPSGQVVVLDFTAFQTQTNADALYIFNGNSINSPQISSGNPSADVPGGLAGGFWGTQLLGQTIVSSNTDGCLTFRFRSNATIQQAGWLANITCIPSPSCASPSNIVTNSISQNSATVSWTENGVPPATQWEVVFIPQGSPPAQNTAPVNPSNVTSSNPFTKTGLNPFLSYNVYIRSICANGSGVSLFSNSPPVLSSNLKLIPFVDINNNGTKQDNEPVFFNGTFSYVVNNNGVVVNNSTNIGISYIVPNNILNTYDIQFNINSAYTPYFASNTIYNDVSILPNSGTNNFFFPIVNTNPYIDVAVYVVPDGAPPRPGFTYRNKIIYTNNGLTPASGTINFSKATLVFINSISPSGSTLTTNGFNFNYTNLMPFETRVITVTMQVPVIPTVTLGNLLTNSASIVSNSTDLNTSNNQSSLTQVIVGSYDPNDIIESRGEKILYSSFNANDYLYYTINFQNLGTASAERVIVDNLLNNSLLNVNTFEMIKSSHNYTVERTGNLLKWTFLDINLASHLTSVPGSQGYIYYRIKPNPGFNIGTIIPNAADIYFDFNPAVITDTFNTEFVAAILSNQDFNPNTVAVYPNPANERVTIKSLETIKNVIISDMQGKKVYQNDFKEGNLQTIDISALAKGVYTISIAVEENVVHQKLILK